MSFTLSVFNAPWKGEKEVTLERGEALTFDSCGTKHIDNLRPQNNLKRKLLRDAASSVGRRQMRWRIHSKFASFGWRLRECSI